VLVAAVVCWCEQIRRLLPLSVVSLNRIIDCGDAGDLLRCCSVNGGYDTLPAMLD